MNVTMGKMTYGISLLSLLFTGCTHTYTLVPGSLTQAHHQIETISTRRAVQLRFRDGHTLKARNLRLTPDSLYTPEGGYALRALEWIRLRRRGTSGLLHGAAEGGLIGLAPPIALLGAILEKGCNDGLGCGIAVAGVVMLSGVTVGAGLVLGGLVGYLYGIPVTYRVRLPETDTSSTTPP
ncbi:hypothetical protein HRbin18_01902 [bacterium HR18]|uniref:Lipoprotein n=2 Tax=Rhodothermus TaxID=29548 RepID=A0A7V2AZD4_RHOMR|nr:hypothetical protein HRbin18_01902 [bacterium HR18]